MSKSKPSQSTPIRKGKLSPEVIKKTAEELTKSQSFTEKVYNNSGKEINKYQVVQVVEAPKIEPIFAQKQVKTPGNYKVYAEALKAMISEHETVEVTGDQLHEIFPQARCGGEVALQLKRSHGLSYRRVENGRNDTYAFSVEPTREELIVMLTSAESKIIELEKEIDSLNRVNNPIYKGLSDEIKYLKHNITEEHNHYLEEKHDLQSDLYNTKYQRNRLFFLVILLIIIITLTNYYG